MKRNSYHLFDRLNFPTWGLNWNPRQWLNKLIVRSFEVLSSLNVDLLDLSHHLKLKQLFFMCSLLMSSFSAMAFSFKVTHDQGINFRQMNTQGVLVAKPQSTRPGQTRMIEKNQVFTLHPSALANRPDLQNLNLSRAGDRTILMNWARNNSGSLQKMDRDGRCGQTTRCDFFVPVVSASGEEGYVALRWLLRRNGAQMIADSSATLQSVQSTEAGACAGDCDGSSSIAQLQTTAESLVAAATAAAPQTVGEQEPTDSGADQWQAYQQFHRDFVASSPHYAAACRAAGRFNNTALRNLRNDFYRALYRLARSGNDALLFDTLGALTAFGEARGESEHEMAATIKVVSNRAVTRFRAGNRNYSRLTRMTSPLRQAIPGVDVDSLPPVMNEVLGRSQFSPWNGGTALQMLLCTNPNSLTAFGEPGDWNKFRAAFRLSHGVRSGQIQFSGGLERQTARHFYAPKSMPLDRNGNRTIPDWARGKTPLRAPGVKLPGESVATILRGAHNFYGF